MLISTARTVELSFSDLSDFDPGETFISRVEVDDDFGITTDSDFEGQPPRDHVRGDLALPMSEDELSLRWAFRAAIATSVPSPERSPSVRAPLYQSTGTVETRDFRHISFLRAFMGR